MKTLLTFAGLLALTASLPADRWPNVGPEKHKIVVITPTSEYVTHEYDDHEIAPKKDAKYHSTYHSSSLGQHYPPLEHFPEIDRHPTPEHYPIPELYPKDYPPPSYKKLSHHEEKMLKKHYNDYLEKQAKFKKNLLQKAVDKTVDLTAKLAQYTADFISKIAIKTAADIAKTGVKTVIHKKEEKFHEDHHYRH